jgi:hypothetical protein
VLENLLLEVSDAAFEGDVFIQLACELLFERKKVLLHQLQISLGEPALQASVDEGCAGGGVTLCWAGWGVTLSPRQR